MFVLLPPNNPAGDLLFTDNHTWTDDEVRAWNDNKIPPATLESLSDETNFLVHFVHFPQAQTSEQVRVSPDDFRKLDRAMRPSITFWIINEEKVLVIPSLDIEFTEQQKLEFREGRINEDLSNAPFLKDCLKKQ